MTSKSPHVPACENLSDSYIRALLCRGTSLLPKNIPQELVEAKREQLETSRLCKLLKRTIKASKIASRLSRADQLALDKEIVAKAQTLLA